MAESGGLLNRCTPKGYHRFESCRLRHIYFRFRLAAAWQPFVSSGILGWQNLSGIEDRIDHLGLFKQLGVGLAVAVLLDATLIRGVLLPAAMKLLGDWNWYLPRWLEWLPSLSPEGAPAEKAPEAPAVPASN